MSAKDSLKPVFILFYNHSISDSNRIPSKTSAQKSYFLFASNAGVLCHRIPVLLASILSFFSLFFQTLMDWLSIIYDWISRRNKCYYYLKKVNIWVKTNKTFAKRLNKSILCLNSINICIQLKTIFKWLLFFKVYTKLVWYSNNYSFQKQSSHQMYSKTFWHIFLRSRNERHLLYSEIFFRAQEDEE